MQISMKLNWSIFIYPSKIIISAKFYQKNKEDHKKILSETSESFQRRKRKKWQYGYERYKNLPEDEKACWVYKIFLKSEKNTLL